jgi:site-specific recombinase XerD
MRESRTGVPPGTQKGHFGQRRGQPAPNAGMDLAAEPLSKDEVYRLLDGCSLRSATGIRNRALVMMLVCSGLRISELLGDEETGRRPLRVSDIDVGRHNIRLLDTKSGKPQTRGFHADATDALVRWIDKRKSLGFTGGPLFCTLKGDVLSDDYVRGLLRRLAVKAGIEKRVHPHGLRHTYAVELEAAGVPVTTISKLLGHSSVAVTARYLDHLTNRQAISALDSISLFPAPEQ